MIEVTRRPYKVTDEDFIRDLFCDIRRPEFAALQLPPIQLAGLLRQQFQLRQAQYAQIPNCEWEMFVEGDQPVGFVGIATSDTELRIVDIALLPSHRNRGIGRRYLDELVARADRHRLNIGLFVEVHNPARRLYVRLGFEEQSLQGVYLDMLRKPSIADEPSVQY